MNGARHEPGKLPSSQSIGCNPHSPSQVCLVEQGFVKDPDLSITKLLDAKGKEVGDALTLRRFVRYQMGAE